MIEQAVAKARDVLQFRHEVSAVCQRVKWGLVCKNICVSGPFELSALR